MCGGCKKPGQGYFIDSTVFADVTDDMVIAEQEVGVMFNQPTCNEDDVTRMYILYTQINLIVHVFD